MSNENVNKVTLIGKIDDDIDLRKYDNDNPFCRFTLVTEESFKKKESDEVVTWKDWHSCNASGRIAEAIFEKYQKGDFVYLEGKLSYRKKDDKRFTNIDIRVIKLLLKVSGDREPYQKPTTHQPQKTEFDDSDGFDSDIPF